MPRQKNQFWSCPCRMDLKLRLYHTLTWSVLIFLLFFFSIVCLFSFSISRFFFFDFAICVSFTLFIFLSSRLHLSHFRILTVKKFVVYLYRLFFSSLGVAFFFFFFFVLVVKSVFGFLCTWKCLCMWSDRTASCEWLIRSGIVAEVFLSAIFFNKLVLKSYAIENKKVREREGKKKKRK